MAGLQDLEKELERKNKFIITETARCHAYQSKFHEAAVVLDRLEGDSCESDLSLNLLLMECLVLLGREIKASKIENYIRNILCGKLNPADCNVVAVLAEGYCGIPNCVKTLVVRKLLIDLYLKSEEPSEKKFSNISSNLHECNSMIREIIKSTNEGSNLANLAKALLKKNDDEETGLKIPAAGSENKLRLFTIAMDYGIEYMKDMYATLKHMAGVDWQKRGKDLASCANSIGFLYGLAGENKKSITWRKEGIKVMDDQYPNSASNFNLYGDLHHNIGVCLYNLDRYLEAKDVYLKAIEIYEKATDYPNPEMREKDLKKSRSDLRDTKDRL